VELTYHPVFGLSEAIENMEQATADVSNDYLDGILFSQNSGVVCIGRLINDVDRSARVQRLTRPTDRWFCLHAKKIIRGTTGPVTEAVPFIDYVFRYDRGGFWAGVYAFNILSRHLTASHAGCSIDSCTPESCTVPRTP
jgi:Delta24-sterol reductase